MSESFLDLSECEDLVLLAEVVAALRRHGPQYEMLLTGATARDVLLHYAHGIPIARATMDIDFAFAIADWTSYGRLRDMLLGSGEFTGDLHVPHRLLFRGVRVDLLPFGGVELSDRTIAWPPHDDFVMHVLGYAEAMASAVRVSLPAGQQLAVVSLPALAILKLLAWHDRHLEQPRKDASDLWQIVRYYLDTENPDRLYEEAMHLLDSPAFDLDQAGAWLLGLDARRLLSSGKTPELAIGFAAAILQRESLEQGTLRLASEMCPANPQAALELLRAFHSGLTGQEQP